MEKNTLTFEPIQIGIGFCTWCEFNDFWSGIHLQPGTIM